MAVIRSRINRKLHKIGARLLHDSLWQAENLNGLVEIALMIKQFGGRAVIMEERFIF
jgi:hypothetical protein